jgi:hypothetical protein
VDNSHQAQHAAGATGPPTPGPVVSPLGCARRDGLWHYVSMDHLRDVPDEAPPFLRTWRRVYIAILAYLVVVIFAFYLFTRAYR